LARDELSEGRGADQAEGNSDRCDLRTGAN